MAIEIKSAEAPSPISDVAANLASAILSTLSLMLTLSKVTDFGLIIPPKLDDVSIGFLKQTLAIHIELMLQQAEINALKQALRALKSENCSC